MKLNILVIMVNSGTFPSFPAANVLVVIVARLYLCQVWFLLFTHMQFGLFLN